MEKIILDRYHNFVDLTMSGHKRIDTVEHEPVTEKKMNPKIQGSILSAIKNN